MKLENIKIDTLIDEYYATELSDVHNGLYSRDKVKMIASEYANLLLSHKDKEISEIEKESESFEMSSIRWESKFKAKEIEFNNLQKQLDDLKEEKSRNLRAYELTLDSLVKESNLLKQQIKERDKVYIIKDNEGIIDSVWFNENEAIKTKDNLKSKCSPRFDFYIHEFTLSTNENKE